MTAYEQGVRECRRYFNRTRPSETTMAQVGAMARVCAKHQYKTPAKQQEFVQGWFGYTQPYTTLFKDYPTKLTPVGIIWKCGNCGYTYDVEYEGEAAVTFHELREDQWKPCELCHDTGVILDEYK